MFYIPFSYHIYTLFNFAFSGFLIDNQWWKSSGNFLNSGNCLSVQEIFCIWIYNLRDFQNFKSLSISISGQWYCHTKPCFSKSFPLSCLTISDENLQEISWIQEIVYLVRKYFVYEIRILTILGNFRNLSLSISISGQWYCHTKPFFLKMSHILINYMYLCRQNYWIS